MSDRRTGRTTRALEALVTRAHKRGGSHYYVVHTQNFAAEVFLMVARIAKRAHCSCEVSIPNRSVILEGGAYEWWSITVICAQTRHDLTEFLLGKYTNWVQLDHAWDELTFEQRQREWRAREGQWVMKYTEGQGD